IHFVFLLPLLVVEPMKLRERFARETSGRVWMLVLGLCAAQYFTVRETALELHFYNASVLLMVATLGIVISLLPRDRAGLVLVPILDPAPDPEAPAAQPAASVSSLSAPSATPAVASAGSSPADGPEPGDALDASTEPEGLDPGPPPSGESRSEETPEGQESRQG